MYTNDFVSGVIIIAHWEIKIRWTYQLKSYYDF